MTHTYVTLEVSPTAYDEIAAKLRAAGYGHVRENGEIDLHGLGLVRGAEQPAPADPEKEVLLRLQMEFGDIIANHCIAMQSALIDGALKSPKDGLAWISNTLWGPGLLPDLTDAKEIGGAQAWFDRETAVHEKFRAEHPGPDGLFFRLPAAIALLDEQRRILFDQAATYLDGLAEDSRKVGLGSQAEGASASARAIRELLTGAPRG